MNTISLDGSWTLRSPQHPELELECKLPGDIHSALIKQGVIVDPYFGCNEDDVQWVGESDWTLTKNIHIAQQWLCASAIELQLSSVDTTADFYVNEKHVLHCENMFQHYRIDILPFVLAGINEVKIVLSRNDLVAKNRSKKQPLPIPWAVGNNKIPHMNLLRKTQCHAGWDWGICLMVSGIYDSIKLQPLYQTKIHQVVTSQQWPDDHRCILKIDVEYECLTAGQQEHMLNITFDNQPHVIALNGNEIGRFHYQHEIEVIQPRRWWPVGYGDQPLYPLSVQLHDCCITKKLGLRQLTLYTATDQYGSAMTFIVNGLPIMAKGANWIPVDALPSRQTPARYRQLLGDAVAANMNMLRVWGGGMYEQDIFYELCDELGLLVWQDFMFSCALYPSTPDFIEDVVSEIAQQIDRLSDHPCLALWCGDNEVIGAINWYPESKTNRERYIVNYDRLNRKLAELVHTRDPSRTFWPSSPCNGDLDYGDAWHHDDKGDMHFWDVWHSGKSFDAYCKIKPRFCSEFGFQSWPSFPTVKTFSSEEEWNITSPTFEQHQKNSRGNSIITEMFTRYFRFPNNFQYMLYLSQVQQALAIKTASEYWRTNKHICRGILYWQLNDCWPVSSWSSIEYTGRWKQLHYHAKRFFDPQLVTFIHEDDLLTLHLINDEYRDISYCARIMKISWAGSLISEDFIEGTITTDISIPLWNEILQLESADNKCFFYHVTCQCDDKIIENTYCPVVYKQAKLITCMIEWQVIEKGNELCILLDSDYPALFVHLEYNGDGIFSESSFTLLPSKISGAKKQVTYRGAATLEQLRDGLKIYDLSNSF